MADCRFPCGTPSLRDSVCIETNRILDSCRDRDCFENVRVFLTGFGNDIIARTGAVRARSAEIIWTSIGVDPIQFNRGFYSVSIRYFVRVVCEACIGGGRSQEFDGLAVLDKNVVLYGGESGVSVFRSDPDNPGFCSVPEPCTCRGNLPVAVVEVVDPVVLGIRITDEKSCCRCCCTGTDIPAAVAASLSGELRPEPYDRVLSVSLGVFSVIRLVRPGQYLVSATEYTVPDKECFEPTDSDPCSVFRKMPFPVSEFGIATPPLPNHPDRPEKRCGG